MSVVTTKAVLYGGWISQVSQDDNDGSCQFHTPHGKVEWRWEDGRRAKGLSVMWRADPSEVDDLAPG